MHQHMVKPHGQTSNKETGASFQFFLLYKLLLFFIIVFYFVKFFINRHQGREGCSFASAAAPAAPLPDTHKKEVSEKQRLR